MQPTTTSQWTNSPELSVTPSGPRLASSPERVLNFFMKWPMNQTSLTEMVCPSCFTCFGQHSGTVHPDAS